MSTAGYATLDVIPSVKNFKSNLERQVAGDMTSAGKSVGQKFGTAAAKESTSSFSKVGSKLGSVAREAIAPVAAAFAAVGIVRWASDTFKSLERIERINAQTTSAIKATGGAAQVSAAHVENLAGQLENMTATEAESIQEGENLLLTFRNIKNEAGAGNDIFDQTTKILVDMSRALGQDATQGAIQLGKALNDPIKGVSALQRVGVSFTQEQKDQIKAFAESGDLMSAQKVVLAELKNEFQGAGRAFAETAQGKIALAGHKFGELSETMLAKTLPAAAALAEGFTKKLAPALEGAMRLAGDVGREMAKIPGPLYAGAAAFLALRTNAAAAIGTSVVAGLTSVASSVETLRLRLMLAGDAYRGLRSASITAVGAGYRFNAGMGRIRAGLSAVRAGAIGAAGAMRATFSSALGVIGGPWGAAFIGATIILTKFWTQQQKTKSQVEELTQTLNKQTGAITKNTRETVAKNLLDSGALDAAKTLGLSLEDVTQAALGNKDAIDRLSKAWAAIPDRAPGGGSDGLTTAEYEAMQKLQGAIGDQGAVVAKAKGDWVLYNDALGQSKTQQDRLTPSTRTYSDVLKDANHNLRELLAAEEKRHLNAVQAKRDEIALIETLKSAQKEARKGKATLDEQTQAGRNNFKALLDVADQWNNSKPKVQAAQGAYKDMRGEFIKLAQQMGATRDEAEKLAKKYLEVPKTAELRFQSKGYRERMAELRSLKAAMDAINRGAGVTTDFSPRGFGSTGPTASSTKAGQRTAPVQVSIGTVNVKDGRDLLRTAQQASLGGRPNAS